MYKPFLIALLCLFTGSLCSQTTNKDSLIKSVELEEVCIITDGDKNQAFGFFRSSKLSSTEDILARMPGVNLTKRGAYGLEPGLRNYNGAQSNLVIDGMRMYGACTDKMDPVSIYIEPGNLQSIDVTHGASGAQAGSTIGGQINLKMREPEVNCHNKVKGVLAQSYMSVNKAYNGNFNLEQSFTKWAYRLSTTYRTAGNYMAGGDSLMEHSAYNKANLSANVLYQINEKHQLKLDVLGDWGRNIGYPALPMDVGRADAGIYALTHNLAIHKGLFKQNEIKIYYNNVYHEMDDTQRPEAPMHMDMPGWSQTVGFYNELTGRGNLKLRLDYHQAYTRADMIMYPPNEAEMYMQTLPENNLHDLGIAAGKTFQFQAQQQVLLNFRLDFYTQAAANGFGASQWTVYNEDITVQQQNLLKNASVGYSKKIKQHSLLLFTVAYGERIPSSNERYGYYLFNRQDMYDYLGNQHLKPEQSLQGELRFEQKFKNIEYHTNLFYHHNTNYIYAYRLDGYSQMTIGALGLKTYKNISYATTQGFEAGAKAELNESFFYIVNLKFVFAQTHDGKPLPLVPPFKLQHALRYTLKYFQLQLEHDFAAAQNRINADYGDKATPAFNLINVRASRNFRIKGTVLQVALACENVFDLLYHEHLDIGQVPRFGRNVMVNLNFMF